MDIIDNDVQKSNISWYEYSSSQEGRMSEGKRVGGFDEEEGLSINGGSKVEIWKKESKVKFMKEVQERIDSKYKEASAIIKHMIINKRRY